MKMRTLSLGSAALLIATLLSTGIVSATSQARQGDRSHGGACLTVTANPTTTPTPTPVTGATAVKAASFSAKVSSRHRCGTIVVLARVRHAARGTTFSASAVAHFASGDVTVQLRRAGKWFIAVGKLKVPAGQAAGDVKVDVTIVYGGAAQPVITKILRMKAPKTGP